MTLHVSCACLHGMKQQIWPSLGSWMDGHGKFLTLNNISGIRPRIYNQEPLEAGVWFHSLLQWKILTCQVSLEWSIRPQSHSDAICLHQKFMWNSPLRVLFGMLTILSWAFSSLPLAMRRQSVFCWIGRACRPGVLTERGKIYAEHSLQCVDMWRAGGQINPCTFSHKTTLGFQHTYQSTVTIHMHKTEPMWV